MSRPRTKRTARASSAPRRPRPTRRLELALSRIASAAVEAQGLDEALRAIHAVLGELIEARNLYVALVDEAEGVLRFPYIVDERASDPGVLPVGHGLAGYVLRTGETLLATPEVFDTLAERGEVDPIGPAAVDWLGAPLRIGGRTIGVIAVQSYTESVRFTEADRGLLTYVSSHVAEAIERKRAEEALRESEERFRLVFEQSPVGIAMIRMDTTYERVNEAFGSLLGRPGSDLLGRKLGEFTHPDDVPRARAMFGRLAAGEIESFRIETRHLRPDHTPVQVLSTVQLVREPTGAGHHVLLQSLDISDLKRAEEEVRRLAYHDALTGLPNRRLFEDRVEVAISHAHRHGQGLVLMFLDLDRFKLINDSLGHGFGDTVLRRVAERLKAALREGDTVARLGGDEFLLLLPDVDQPADAARIADKLLDVTSRPINVGEREVIVTCSIGISVFPEDGLDAGTLIRNADTAMYRAKDEGREGHQLYAPAMNERALERLALEHGLRRAISQGELELHYQPILTLETGRVHGVEALLRWNHPLWGWVPPAEFIPIAECTGLIGTLGAWVLRTACLQVRQWQRDGHAELVLAVNLAPRQFQQPGIHELVETILRETGLAPHHLELEVTESSALQNPEASTANLRRLEALGIRVSIDDFGTGYSSLSYLRRFPVNIVKIDKSFVQDITSDADDAAIAKAVIAMAHSLHLTVTAEGVETADQLAFLSSHGCDRVQGFLFSRALPPRECEVLLARHGPGEALLTT